MSARLVVLGVLFVALHARAEEYGASGSVRGRVIDAASHAAIAGAVVTLGAASTATDESGAFAVTRSAGPLLVRAVGHGRESVALPRSEPLEIALAPFRAKALYLSFYGIGSRELRERALRLVERTELNALVIDVKSDTGKIPYRSGVPLAASVGAQGPTTIGDVGALIADLKARGIYTIARIVVFKDEPLATARPELAVKARDGSVWHDRERLAWTDPFQPAVRDYNIEVAVEAARNGFDEIQFDYVRFPDAVGLVYAQPSTLASRVAAISQLFRDARARLAPYNVFLSGDVFGYVCWNRDDTMIGQRIEDLAPLVDYVSPMLYPSSFQFGIPGFRRPVEHPYEIVRRSLELAKERTKLPGERFRPWLQAFKDYAFDRRSFDVDEIRTQITAAEDAGAAGWMLWNPRNDYSASGLGE